jgi:hypothetical protein
MLSPEEVVQQLRDLRARIPMPAGLPEVSVDRRRRLSNVAPQFIDAAINAAGVSSEVESLLGRTSSELRDDDHTAGRWTAAIDETRAMLQILVDANTVRRQRVGLAALQTYHVCRQLARDDAQAARLSTHIAEMKRLNKFGRSRRKAPQPDTQPPAPQQPA